VIGELQPWHLLIVAIVFIVLFGSKKLPDASRSLGRSLRIFKSEMNEMKTEFKAGATDNATAPTTPAPAAIQAAQPVTPVVQPVTPAAAVPTDTPSDQPKA
jgi:sec-independent protein translocase protein TatA